MYILDYWTGNYYSELKERIQLIAKLFQWLFALQIGNDTKIALITSICFYVA